MTTKYLPTAVAAFAARSSAIAGLTSLVPVGSTDTPQIGPVVSGASSPIDPVAVLPTVEQLAGARSGLQDAGVPFTSRAILADVATAGAAAATAVGA